MSAAMFATYMLANPWFRTFVTGSGFFADSYDLFITDGVTNILKNEGPQYSPTYAVATNWNNVTGQLVGGTQTGVATAVYWPLATAGTVSYVTPLASSGWGVTLPGGSNPSPVTSMPSAKCTSTIPGTTGSCSASTGAFPLGTNSGGYTGNNLPSFVVPTAASNPLNLPANANVFNAVGPNGGVASNGNLPSACLTLQSAFPITTNNPGLLQPVSAAAQATAASIGGIYLNFTAGCWVVFTQMQTPMWQIGAVGCVPNAARNDNGNPTGLSTGGCDLAYYPNPNYNGALTYNYQKIGYYQKQNTNLKNGVNNAALIGSIFGQLFFGFAGDLCGRKWNFVITSMLLIIGALGTATASAGQTVPCGSGVGSTYAVNTGSGAYYPNALIPTVTAYPLASGMCSDGSSLPTGSFNDVYMQLNIWRGLLGFGVGGEYPLASTITSESTSNLVSRGVAVLSIFSMQGWGKLSAAIVNYACIATTLTFGGGWVIDAVWRFSMAFGCALNLITLFFRWHMHESKIYGDRHHMETTGEVSKDDDIPTLDSGIMAIAATSEPNSPVVDAAEPVKGTNTTKATDMVITKHDGNIATDMKPLDGWTSVRVISEYWWTLFGTAATWFLIDVTFYGQSLMNTTVIYAAVAGSSNSTAWNSMYTLQQALLGTVYVMLIALPGYWFAIGLIDRMGRFNMQIFGFMMSAICFTILASTWGTAMTMQAGAAGYVVFYGLTYFFANFGPNSVTFLQPVECYPTRARTLGHGFSAAMGKIGATAGSFGLLLLYNSYCPQTSAGTQTCTSSFCATDQSSVPCSQDQIPAGLSYTATSGATQFWSAKCVNYAGALCGPFASTAATYATAADAIAANCYGGCGGPGAAGTTSSLQAGNGVIAVNAWCAGISLLGFLIAMFFTKETGTKTLEEVDASSMVMRLHDLEILKAHNAKLAALAAKVPA